MIASAATAEAAVVVPFAPPLGPTWRYHEVSVRSRPDGETRVSLDQDLRFAAAPGGELIATVVARGVTIAAPPAALPVLHALFDGYEGTPTTGRLAADGRVLGMVDGAATWAAVRERQEAALAALDHLATPSADDRARARALEQVLTMASPDDRDAQLAEALAVLLPPPLPPLRPGEPRRFTADLPNPAGPLPAGGTATLVAADAATLRVRIEVRSDPQAAAAAAAGLHGALSPTASAAERTRLAAAAAAAATAVFAQTLDVVLDRTTGLLVASSLRRTAIDGTGAAREIERVEITRTLLR